MPGDVAGIASKKQLKPVVEEQSPPASFLLQSSIFKTVATSLLTITYSTSFHDRFRHSVDKILRAVRVIVFKFSFFAGNRSANETDF